MPYVTGTANSATDLQDAIKAFAIRSLGTFEDLFDGSLGLSSFGTQNYSVLGLRHRTTGAAYLFDVVAGEEMHNDVGEDILLGQLLDSVSGAILLDFGAYIDGEGTTVAPPSVDCTFSWTQEAPASGDIPARYSFDAAMEGIGALSGIEVGQAIVIKDGNVRHIVEISELTDTSEGVGTYTQEVEGFYLGSYNAVTGDTSEASPGSFSEPPSGSGDQDDFLITEFLAQTQDLLANTAFGAFSSNMWGRELTADEIRQGGFPRSGRLDFSAGVNYEFYGSANPRDEHFYMVLTNEGSQFTAKTSTHWWLGRLSTSVNMEVTPPGGSTYTVGDLTTGSANPTGLFLGTSGPYTDEEGNDIYQYPFSFQNAKEAFRNPCSIITYFTDDGADDTIKQNDGGRNGYGPTGSNHQNSYGPNLATALTLQSTRYSIQAGLNGFAGGTSLGMDGARARTYYPLRPAAVSAPPAFPSLSGDKQYIFPWAPVEAVVYGCPMPDTQGSIATEDPAKFPADLASLVSASGGVTVNADGWAEQALTTTADPQTHFWRANGVDGLSYTAADPDRVQVRVRMKTDAVGGTRTNDLGVLFISTSGATSFGISDNQVSFSWPDGFYDNEWVTLDLKAEDGDLPSNWTTGTVITGLRIDVFGYDVAPTTGAVLEWDFITVGDIQVMRDAKYMAGNGGYAVHLGQFPSLGRGSMNPAVTAFAPNRAEANFEGQTYVTVPASQYALSGGLARPYEPTENSGMAGYVYKR